MSRPRNQRYVRLLHHFQHAYPPARTVERSAAWIEHGWKNLGALRPASARWLGRISVFQVASRLFALARRQMGSCQGTAYAHPGRYDLRRRANRQTDSLLGALSDRRSRIRDQRAGERGVAGVVAVSSRRRARLADAGGRFRSPLAERHGSSANRCGCTDISRPVARRGRRYTVFAKTDRGRRSGRGSDCTLGLLCARLDWQRCHPHRR